MLGLPQMKLRDRYESYLAFADDGTGREIGTGTPVKTKDDGSGCEVGTGEWLKTFDEWLGV